MKNIHLILVFLFYKGSLFTQIISMNDCVKLALENSKMIYINELEVKRVHLETKSILDVRKFEINYMNGQYNSIQKNDNQWNFSQTIPFPSSFYFRNKMSQIAENKVKNENDIYIEDLIFNVKITYQDLVLSKKRILLLQREDSIFKALDEKLKIKLNFSEISPNDYLTFTNLRNKNYEKLKCIENEFLQLQNKLNQLIGLEINIEPDLSENFNFLFNTDENIEENLRLINYKIKYDEKSALKKYNFHVALPDLTFSYFNQTLIGTQDVNGKEIYFGSEKRFQGFNVALSVPLYYANISRKNKAISIEQNQIELEKKLKYFQLQQEYKNNILKLKSLNDRLLIFQDDILPNNNLIKNRTFIKYQNGEISQVEWLYHIQSFFESEWDYLSLINEKNNTIIYLQWITGKEN